MFVDFCLPVCLISDLFRDQCLPSKAAITFAHVSEEFKSRSFTGFTYDIEGRSAVSHLFVWDTRRVQCIPWSPARGHFDEHSIFLRRRILASRWYLSIRGRVCPLALVVDEDDLVFGQASTPNMTMLHALDLWDYFGKGLRCQLDLGG